MAFNINGTTPTAINFNGNPVYTLIFNGVTVWTAAATVTYYVDSGTSYQENVVYGNSVLSPSSFTPSKSGYTFVGWRENSTANSSVLTSKTMGTSPISLYAVFKKTVTITYYNNSTTKSTASGTQYYNNGNVANPTFTITQASKSGWTARGWATGTGASASVAYSSINGTEFSTNTTLYGLYYQTITLSYNGNGSTSGSVSSQTGTRYYNSAGNTSNPNFTLKSNGFSKTNYNFAKWAQGSASGTQYTVGASVTLSASTTFYAVWVAITNYGYTGEVQTYTAPVAGTYKLEVWGAQGCSNVNNTLDEGGLGGYSYGNVSLSAGQKIYIVVGQYERQLETASYNGGGAGGGYAGAGGGATHIATTNRGELKNYASYKSEVLIVAGGGGGSAHSNTYADWMYGGTGGGTSGGGGRLGGGATQSAGGNLGPNNMQYAGSFGLGGYAASGSGCGGGGGGWYGGSGAFEYNGRAGGGGGSGYIGGVSGGATSNGVRAGSGYATIRFVS